VLITTTINKNIISERVISNTSVPDLMFEVFEGVCIPVPFFLVLGKGCIDGNYGDEQRTVCTICSANDVSSCYLNVTFLLFSVFSTSQFNQTHSQN